MALQEANKLANQNTTKLLKAAEELTKVIDSLKTTTELHGNLTYTIEEKEEALSELETKFQEEARRRQVDLELAFKENEIGKVNQILQSQGKIAVNQVEYNELVNTFTSLKTEFAKKLEEEAGKIRGQEAGKTAAAIKTAQLELQVKESGNAAAIQSLTDKNVLLSTQVEDYKAQLSAERNARIEEAKARGNPSVVVQSGK